MAGETAFRDCYAQCEDSRLTVGNAEFERVWMAGEGGLQPVSFLLKNPDTEWFAGMTAKPAAATTLEVTATTGRRGVVGSEGLRVEVATTGANAERQVLWVFPGLAGVLAERAGGAEEILREEQRQATGIETEPAKKPQRPGLGDHAQNQAARKSENNSRFTLMLLTLSMGVYGAEVGFAGGAGISVIGVEWSDDRSTEMVRLSFCHLSPRRGRPAWCGISP